MRRYGGKNTASSFLLCFLLPIRPITPDGEVKLKKRTLLSLLRASLIVEIRASPMEIRVSLIVEISPKSDKQKAQEMLGEIKEPE